MNEKNCAWGVYMRRLLAGLGFTVACWATRGVAWAETPSLEIAQGTARVMVANVRDQRQTLLLRRLFELEDRQASLQAVVRSRERSIQESVSQLRNEVEERAEIDPKDEVAALLRRQIAADSDKEIVTKLARAVIITSNWPPYQDDGNPWYPRTVYRGLPYAACYPWNGGSFCIGVRWMLDINTATRAIVDDRLELEVVNRQIVETKKMLGALGAQR